jgi:hypothetical protein
MHLLYRQGVQSRLATRTDGAGRRPESTWLWRLFPWDWPDMATQESDGADNSESRGARYRRSTNCSAANVNATLLIVFAIVLILLPIFN